MPDIEPVARRAGWKPTLPVGRGADGLVGAGKSVGALKMDELGNRVSELGLIFGQDGQWIRLSQAGASSPLLLVSRAIISLEVEQETKENGVN